jgi:hypothetical protein
MKGLYVEAGMHVSERHVGIETINSLIIGGDPSLQ